MSMHSWTRGLFTRPAIRTIRQVPRRSRLAVEALEDRRVPSAATDHILVQYKNDGAIHKVALHEGVTVEQALADYRSRAGVAIAVADQLVSVAATIPNDPLFPLDYGLNNIGQAIPAAPYVGTTGAADADIDAPEAWDVTRGSMTTTVAVLDSGIQYTHNDLYLNIWINPGEIPADIRGRLTDVDGDSVITFRDLNNGVNQGTGKISDLNGNGYIDGADLIQPAAQGGWADGVNQDASSDPVGTGYTDDLIGWDFLNHDNDPYDDNGHGTHVAGTIGAIANNSNGVAGVNWFVQMAALKFIGADGWGLHIDAIAALDYAVAKGIKVSNNSWGGHTEINPLLTAAIENARSAGHIFVASAGNDSLDTEITPHYPATYDIDNIIAVAATDNNDVLASFSNYGESTVALAAPGWKISSTYNNNTYAYANGTSMAAPHVTGVVALIMSVKQGLTYDQVIDQVLNNVDVLGSLSGKVATGGRLNAYRAVTGPGPNTSAPMVVSLTPSVAADNSISSVRVIFTEAIGDNPGTGTFSFTAADVSGFTGPSGAAIQATGIQAVANSGGKAFDITFARQTAGGTYRLTLGPNIHDTIGDPMNQDGDYTPGESPQDQYKGRFVLIAPVTFSNPTDVKIFDQTTVTSSIDVTQTLTIGDVNVKVNLSHKRIGDLRLTLISPAGTRVKLFDQRGGSGDNLTNTVFDDEAATPISAGAAPFSGSFRPEVSLSALDGSSASGTWRLEISDLAQGTSGTLTDWSITFIPGGSGSGNSQSLGGDGPAEVLMGRPAPGTRVNEDGMAARLAAVDATPFLFDATPGRELVPPTSRAADSLRFASPVAYESVTVHGEIMRQTPARPGGQSEAAPAVSNPLDWVEQVNEWLGEEDFWAV